MGKGIFRIDKAFKGIITTESLPDGFKLLGQSDNINIPAIDCEYESELIPEVAAGTDLPVIVPIYYQEKISDGRTAIRLEGLMVYGEFEEGKFEQREIYKREN